MIVKCMIHTLITNTTIAHFVTRLKKYHVKGNYVLAAYFQEKIHLHLLIKEFIF